RARRRRDVDARNKSGHDDREGEECRRMPAPPDIVPDHDGEETGVKALLSETDSGGTSPG
ncbi:MAG: hypothetical protein OYH76_04260, partial [Defluviicoccus sp.]|nr:hypothetical protein [Defluviicoccus sp.]